ncbi:MAG: hypothetical protein AAGK04_08430 [Planctomycetota bacterium]
MQESKGVVCPDCGYDLRDRVDPSLCTECGARITDAEAVKIWKDCRMYDGFQDWLDWLNARRDRSPPGP